MRAGPITLLALVVAGLATLAACELNPQPLPPGPDSEFSPGGSDGDEDASATGFGADSAAPNPPSDAGTVDIDGGDRDGGDAGDDGGDAADGGDASPDATVGD